MRLKIKVKIYQIKLRGNFGNDQTNALAMVEQVEKLVKMWSKLIFC